MQGEVSVTGLPFGMVWREACQPKRSRETHLASLDDRRPHPWSRELFQRIAKESAQEFRGLVAARVENSFAVRQEVCSIDALVVNLLKGQWS